MPLRFDNSYSRLPSRLFSSVEPTPVDAPAWLAVNPTLGALLGLSEEELRSSEMLAVLAGNMIPRGAEPIALAYAGHQFGNFVPRLGDGRAVLLGEVLGADGARRDVQLKGSGPTPYSRGGDGRAALGPVLRELLLSEAMHALGVPTTRSLAAVLTGERVYRETALPGAVLTRVASSHLRVGTFEYVAAQRDEAALAALVSYALERHYPDHTDSEVPAIGLLEATLEAQATLVAKWLALGFVHGVMNTDNCAISGETIDYGPCAFLDAYDPARTFSSIDRGGRYAFANQPRIALWNLARLAEALAPLFGPRAQNTAELLEERLEAFQPRFDAAYAGLMRDKLGLLEQREGDLDLARRLLSIMASDRADYTLVFRRLIHSVEGDDSPIGELFASQDRLAEWLAAWRLRLQDEPTTTAERAARMRSASPAFIARNHRVEEAIAAATRGDLGPFERLRTVLARPYEDQPEHADLAAPPGEEQWKYKTFCGT